MYRAGTTLTSYVRLRDVLMTELVLNGGANRGEILRKMTLSVRKIISLVFVFKLLTLRPILAGLAKVQGRGGGVHCPRRLREEGQGQGHPSRKAQDRGRGRCLRHHRRSKDLQVRVTRITENIIFNKYLQAHRRLCSRRPPEEARCPVRACRQ